MVPQCRRGFAVAYSGGLDSSVLLHASVNWTNRNSARLAAVHINHGLSPDATKWSTHCVQTCARLGVPIRVIDVVVPRGSRDGLESAARAVRYEALMGATDAPILLAHHADDQAETMLHNLFRGTGLRGLAGMQTVRGRFLRPFLEFTREDLLEYARSRDLKWLEDESNKDNRFTRNFIRNCVTPSIAGRFPGAASQMARCAQRLSEAQSLLDQLAEVDADGMKLEFPFRSSKFDDLSVERARNLLLVLINRAGLQNPGDVPLKEFLSQLAHAGPDGHPEMRLGRKRIRREKGQLILI